jgi:DNA-binding transcriptional ArsR family regulator
VETNASPALTALGDSTRQAIVELLSDGRGWAVGELARELPVTRPAVSQHLKVLKQARLVVDEPIGTRRLYRLNPTGISHLHAELDRFWSRTLESFKREAERSNKETSHAGDQHGSPALDRRGRAR